MQNWEQTYHLQPGGAVRTEQEHGAMRVTGWDQPLVKLTATARGNSSVTDLTVGQDARGLTVEAGGGGGVVVAVPAHAGIDLDVETGAGMITYTGPDLRVRHAEPGELGATLNHGGAKLNIETGSGNVQVRPAAAPEVLIAPRPRRS